MQNSKNAGAMLRYSEYTAAIFDENGNDQGPVNISSAQNDEQARALAKRKGVKWLEENGLNQATIQIYRNGHSLPLVEVQNRSPGDKFRSQGRGNRQHKLLN
jgi:hypothetical protein